MFKLIVFTLVFIASPTFGLIETIFQAESNCYSGCHSNYPTSLIDVYACQSGCDYKLHNENCADQCKLLSIEEQTQASCLVGCSMNQLEINKRPPPSITVIRLRPLIEIKPVEISNEHVDEKMTSTDLSISDKIRAIFHLTKNLRTELFNDNRTNTIKHFIIRQQDKLQSSSDQFHEYVHNLHGRWNDLTHQQSNTTSWILLSLFLLSSIVFVYMIVSLCRRRPRYHTLSIRAQDLAFDNTYENEKIQPNEHYCRTPQSGDMKIKLANI